MQYLLKLPKNFKQCFRLNKTWDINKAFSKYCCVQSVEQIKVYFLKNNTLYFFYSCLFPIKICFFSSKILPWPALLQNTQIVTFFCRFGQKIYQAKPKLHKNYRTKNLNSFLLNFKKKLTFFSFNYPMTSYVCMYVCILCMQTEVKGKKMTDFYFHLWMLTTFINIKRNLFITQPIFTCSKSTVGTQEKGVKYVQN